MSARPTKQRSGTYTPEQYAALADLAKGAELRHLFAAAEFLAELFQANDLPFAFMGGFALNLRGSNRDTHDVDVAVGCTMQRLIDVVSTQTRVRRPAGPTSGMMRVFIWVEGVYDPGVSDLWVVGDIILGGSLGAPDQPQESSEVASYNTSAGPRQLPIIDILNAMASKLNAYYVRQAPSDYIDLMFLISKYFQQIFEIRGQLSTAHRAYFVASFEQGNTGNAVKSLKHLLNVA